LVDLHQSYGVLHQCRFLRHSVVLHTTFRTRTSSSAVAERLHNESVILRGGSLWGKIFGWIMFCKNIYGPL